MDNRASDREQRLAGVISSVLSFNPVAGRILAVGGHPTFDEELSSTDAAVEAWHRHGFGERSASPWPTEGPFDAAFLRLPRGRVAQEMTLHATAGRLTPGAPLWVYGANDEGIRSYARHLTPFFDSVETVATKHHCRVISGVLRAELPPLRKALADWAQPLTIPLPTPGYSETTVDLSSWPGLFAHNRLDPGSAQLLAALPALSPHGRVLDFGCGSGILALAARLLNPELQLTLLDVDALAVHASRLNVPGAQVVLSDSFRGLGSPEPYDLILSNPPIHVGKDEDFSALTELINKARDHLTAQGKLVMVVQRTAGVGRLMKSAFAKSTTLSENNLFQVWCGKNS